MCMVAARQLSASLVRHIAMVPLVGLSSAHVYMLDALQLPVNLIYHIAKILLVDHASVKCARVPRRCTTSADQFGPLHSNSSAGGSFKCVECLVAAR